ncbi:hypothetical protein [Kineococcus radiotolerans]|uniref:Uncharacterized protein n=1 Tax=Kineococcus radiotolerans (strain ATCC BAA-149 / DSM 14245 / SRS30216) TaxID=266940 RepID=A6WGX6_KINRD|nr:hypothetical protein [Kineococcus radiotolerans]ABS06065.1 hypothetical protein Krad_4606 [Kineococcus radiotolerans SRS30216 = ATCC BAA-149]
MDELTGRDLDEPSPLGPAARSSVDDSTAARDQRCVQRLEDLGVHPGISLRRLLTTLRKQEGRPIKITQRGQHGRLLHLPAKVSALVDRDPERRSILVWIPEDPKRSMRGKRVLLHELAHLIVTPRDELRVVSQVIPVRAADGEQRLDGLNLPVNADLPEGVDLYDEKAIQFHCNVEDDEEREVEWTAGLLQHYMAPWMQQRELPPASGLGLFVTRRGSTDESAG